MRELPQRYVQQPFDAGGRRGQQQLGALPERLGDLDPIGAQEMPDVNQRRPGNAEALADLRGAECGQPAGADTLAVCLHRACAHP